ncbi:MAG: hypothetical protein ABSF26_25850 [Thermoguttaceae bacterium]|jgi:hypothetical protein
MLVILSDLHLNDGSTGATLQPGALALFAERLKELALAASWRADGAYRPIERIDLVLLGDVLDLLHSARWNDAPGIRPWGDTQSPEFVEQAVRITGDILTQNQESVGILRTLAAEGEVTVPPLLRVARPAPDGQRQPVLVRIHYMVGNHDWFYHLPGAAYDALRRTLVEQLGLAQPADRPLPHDITESDELLQTMRRHKVTARHGDIFDPLSFEGDRDASSLGDAITLDVVNRFAVEVEQALGEELPDAAVLGLREIDHLRPLLLIPAWIEGVLEQTCPQPAARKRVKMVWDRLVDELLASPLVRQREACGALDLIDGLARGLKFSKRLSTGWSRSVVEWLRQMRGASSDSYAGHVLTEQDYRNRRAKHVVFGHTHAAEIVPLDASHAEGYVLDQMYFNTGTWRRVYRQTRFAPGEHEFIVSDAMGYVAFFQGDERKGRPYETWFGTLGYCPAERTVHRIDAGRGRHVAGQSVSTSSVPPHAPHFAAFSAPTGGAALRRRT